jgi:hypothetical protein
MLAAAMRQFGILVCYLCTAWYAEHIGINVGPVVKECSGWQLGMLMQVVVRMGMPALPKRLEVHCTKCIPRYTGAGHVSFLYTVCSNSCCSSRPRGTQEATNAIQGIKESWPEKPPTHVAPRHLVLAFHYPYIVSIEIEARDLDLRQRHRESGGVL